MAALGTELRTYFSLKFQPVFKRLFCRISVRVCRICVTSVRRLSQWKFVLCVTSRHISLGFWALLILHFASHAKCCLQAGGSRSKAKQLHCHMNFSNSKDWASSQDLISCLVLLTLEKTGISFNRELNHKLYIIWGLFWWCLLLRI